MTTAPSVHPTALGYLELPVTDRYREGDHIAYVSNDTGDITYKEEPLDRGYLFYRNDGYTYYYKRTPVWEKIPEGYENRKFMYLRIGLNYEFAGIIYREDTGIYSWAFGSRHFIGETTDPIEVVEELTIITPDSGPAVNVGGCKC